MGIFEKFKIGFQKSASNLTARLKEIILKKEIDDHTLNKIEDFLISSDVGEEAASEIKDIISSKQPYQKWLRNHNQVIGVLPLFQ